MLSDFVEDIDALVDSSDEEQQRSSPPKTPMLRPAPFPVVLDVLPAFDMLPDAVEDFLEFFQTRSQVECNAGGGRLSAPYPKDGDCLGDPSEEDCSMLLFGPAWLTCIKGTAATCLAATNIKQLIACHAVSLDEEPRHSSPPKAPRLRPAPSPVSLDALPAFDRLPDAIEETESLIPCSMEDNSMLFSGADECSTKTAATCLVANDIERHLACDLVSLDEEPAIRVGCSKEDAMDYMLTSALEEPKWLRGQQCLGLCDDAQHLLY
jgi:hypothetical protein